MADGRGIELVEAMFAAGRDLDAYMAFFDENALYRAGNQPAVQGREAIREVMARLRGSGLRVSHQMSGTWQKGDVVVCEMEVSYAHPDGRAVTLPCVDIFRVTGDKVREMRVYIDMSPVFALMKPAGSGHTTSTEEKH